MAKIRHSVLCAALLGISSAAAQQGFKVDERDDIIKSAATVASDLVALYEGVTKGSDPCAQVLTAHSTTNCFLAQSISQTCPVYTGKETYAETATKLYDWLTEVKLISNWRVMVETLTSTDCKGAGDALQYYSLNGTLVTQGAAFMYNFTGGREEWRTRVEKLTASVLKDFFPGNHPFEPDGEMHELCTADEIAYRGVHIQLLAVVTQIAPFTADTIFPAIRNTATDIAHGCIQDESKRRCMFTWIDIVSLLVEYEPETTGMGEEMNALSAFSNLLIKEAAPPAVAPPSSENGGKAGDDGDVSVDSDGEDGSEKAEEGGGGGVAPRRMTTIRRGLGCLICRPGR